MTTSQTIEERPDECETTCGHVDIQEEQVDVETLNEGGVFLIGYGCVCYAFFFVLSVTTSQTTEERPDEFETTCGRVDIQEERVNVEILDEAGVCMCACIHVNTIPRRITDFDDEDPQHPPPNGGFVHKALRYIPLLVPTNQRRMERKTSCYQQKNAFYHSFVYASHSSRMMRKI